MSYTENLEETIKEISKMSSAVFLDYKGEFVTIYGNREAIDAVLMLIRQRELSAETRKSAKLEGTIRE